MISSPKLPLTSLLVTVMTFAPTMAQVPVNDAARTDTETRTRVCMTRARTFKQASVAPSHGVTISVSSNHDTAGMGGVSGQSVFGVTFSGTTIAGSEFQILAAVAGSIAAIKPENVGQVLNSLAAVLPRSLQTSQPLKRNPQPSGPQRPNRARSIRTRSRVYQPLRSGTRRSRP